MAPTFSVISYDIQNGKKIPRQMSGHKIMGAYVGQCFFATYTYSYVAFIAGSSLPNFSGPVNRCCLLCKSIYDLNSKLMVGNLQRK
jgi:hypothetical protein